jgi:hypothetical protein
MEVILDEQYRPEKDGPMPVSEAGLLLDLFCGGRIVGLVVSSWDGDSQAPSGAKATWRR